MDLFYVAMMVLLWRSCHRKWSSCVGVIMWDLPISIRDKKQRKGKITGFVCEESLGSWRDWESHMCALALPHGCVLPLPRPLSPQGCLSMQVTVSLLRCTAFTCSGSLAVWDGLFADKEHICASWVGLPPTFLSLQNASPPFASWMFLRGLVLGCLSSWEFHPMFSDFDLYHITNLRHQHICLFYLITIRMTKGKLRQRKASSKSLLCNHYHFFFSHAMIVSMETGANQWLRVCVLLVPVTTETCTLDCQKLSYSCPAKQSGMIQE